MTKEQKIKKLCFVRNKILTLQVAKLIDKKYAQPLIAKLDIIIDNI